MRFFSELQMQLQELQKKPLPKHTQQVLSGAVTAVMPASDAGTDPMTDVLVRGLLFLFPLLIVRRTAGFSEKDLCFYIILLIMTIRSILAYAKEHALTTIALRRPVQICAAVFLALFILIIRGALTLDTDLPRTAMYAGGLLLLFCMGRVQRRDDYYLHLFLASALIVFVWMYSYLMFGTAAFSGIADLLQDTASCVPFLLLACAVSALLYVKEDGGIRSIFYAAMAVAGFGLLFLYGEMLSVCLMELFLLMLPAWRKPTPALIKKTVILILLFVFTASNAPLILYAGASGAERNVNLEYSLYIDVALAAAGLLISRYREKTPEEDLTEDKWTPRLITWFAYVRRFVAAFLLFCYFFSDRIARLDGGAPGVKTLQAFTASLRRAADMSGGVYWHVLQRYGVIGFALLFALTVMLTLRLKRLVAEDAKDMFVWTYLAGLMVVQGIFYPLSMMSMPVYFIFLACATGHARMWLDASEEKKAVNATSKEIWETHMRSEFYLRRALYPFVAAFSAVLMALLVLTFTQLVRMV